MLWRNKHTGAVVDAEQFDGERPILVRTPFGEVHARKGEYVILSDGEYFVWPKEAFEEEWMPFGQEENS